MDKLITKPAVVEVLREYWKQYKNRAVDSTLGLILPAVGSIFLFFVPPIIVSRIVNLISSGVDLNFSNVGHLLLLFLVSAFAGEICWRGGIYFVIRVQYFATKNLANDAFKRLTERDYDFYTNSFVGTLTRKALGFSGRFETFTDTIVFSIFGNLIPIIFATIVLWKYSPLIPLALILWVMTMVAVALPFIRRRSRLVAERHEASSRTTGRLSDALTNMFAIKSFATEDKERAAYSRYVDDTAEKYRIVANYHNFRTQAALSPLYVLSNATGLLAAIFFIHRLGLEAGVVVVVFSYYAQITRIVWDMNGTYRGIEASISEAAEFTQMLIAPPAVQDISGAQDLKVTDSVIKFDSVGFKYDNDQDNLFLKDFNLEIKANQKVGLVGPSGGGKTTITKLILRFIDLQDGHIAVDGQDISRVTQTSLRKAISYVPQEPLLFHRSLFENIAYGKDDATEEEVIKAAQLAHADEFISVLPNGYKTLVGERGIKLSGGQRQRVAIARAILKNAPILVLDEATSSLDSESEKYIQEGLWELMKDKTALVIAHRLSTIKHLDRIIVLADGKIVQDGTHDELVKQKGLYATLWSHQSGEFLGED